MKKLKNGRRFFYDLFRFSPRRLAYLVTTLGFLLLAVLHDSKWILAMVFTAFMYKARKPRDQKLNQPEDIAMHHTFEQNPDYLHQEFHDKLKGVKTSLSFGERENSEEVFRK